MRPASHGWYIPSSDADVTDLQRWCDNFGSCASLLGLAPFRWTDARGAQLARDRVGRTLLRKGVCLVGPAAVVSLRTLSSPPGAVECTWADDELSVNAATAEQLVKAGVLSAVETPSGLVGRAAGAFIVSALRNQRIDRWPKSAMPTDAEVAACLAQLSLRVDSVIIVTGRIHELTAHWPPESEALACTVRPLCSSAG